MIKRFAVTELICSVFILMSGCFSGLKTRDEAVQDKVVLHKSLTLPAGSSADSHHAENIYRYYPEKKIYYDVKKGLYFYLENDRWISSSSIPARLSTDIGSFITLEMDTDKPYQNHDEVQEKYSSSWTN